MDTKKLFLSALSSASSAIAMVSNDDFTKPTPDTEWNVKALVGHMLYELSWTPDVVNGHSINDVGGDYDGDLIGDSLQDNWSHAEASAREAVSNCDLDAVAHLSWKDATNDYYLKQAASDQLIHSWDLSAALGSPVKFDDEVAIAVLSNSNRQEMTSSSLYAPPIDVSDDSDIQTKLLGLYGRNNGWQP